MEKSPKKQWGCGVKALCKRIFGRRIRLQSRKTPVRIHGDRPLKKDSADRLGPHAHQKQGEKPSTISKSIVYSKTANAHFQDAGNKPSKAIVPASALASGGTSKKGVAPRKVQKGMTISGELDSIIADYQSKTNGKLVRASSSNVMVVGDLGNLRQLGNANSNFNSNNRSVPNNGLDYLPAAARETTLSVSSKGGTRNPTMGNIVTKPTEKLVAKGPPAVLGRPPSNKLEAEGLKVMGNEEYKKGRYAEALALYEKAIVIDPSTASYRSNKSAALMGLGRLLEAIDECREAVKIDPSYCRAHHRLATLYHRLGETEKAQNHYKESGDEANVKEIEQARALQTHLLRCREARKLHDSYTLLKEAGCAISSGADSAPQVFAWKAEALLKLQRHQDAETVLSSSPVFDTDASINFFGAAAHVYFLLIRVQVDMASGRFEEAVEGAQQAARLNPGNREARAVVARARAVASARSKGNDLYKASKFREAITAYGEGLLNDPINAILLCNRAACRSKLGQWEKAVEDCNSALKLRPSYSKARLRRAHCNAKLERWSASIEDYEALIRECPEDAEVGRALFKAQAQLKTLRGEDTHGSELGADVVLATSNDRFKHFVTAPGMSLDIEDNPSIAKSEGMGSVPAFKIYKNGSKDQDVNGTDQEVLETSVKNYSN